MFIFLVSGGVAHNTGEAERKFGVNQRGAGERMTYAFHVLTAPHFSTRECCLIVLLHPGIIMNEEYIFL